MCRVGWRLLASMLGDYRERQIDSRVMLAHLT